MMVRYVRCLLLVASALPVFAQESLDALLDREYVAQWLVCGPFAPDVEGGIVAATKRGDAPLGGTNFMAPAGGVARLRPTDESMVQTGERVVSWRAVRGEGPCIDLASLFEERQEGVAYAAFYADARDRQQVYLDVQTPLGARIYLNGFPVRNVQAAPAEAAGLDRFVATMRQGQNLVVMEVPCASLDALAEAMGMTSMALRAAGFPNRPLLHGLSGFEVGLRIRPAAELAGVVYVPRLRSTGVLSGFGDDVRQDAILTLFNPSSSPTPALMVEAFVAGGGKPVRQAISPIPPGVERQAIISVPVGQASSGQTVTVEVTLQYDKETVQFNTAVHAQPHASGGTVYVVTGQRHRPSQCEDQAVEMGRRLSEFNRNLQVLDSDPKYGFDLGGVAYWKSALDVNPLARDAVRRAVGTLRCGTHAGFCTPDERIVGGEVLARNLMYGAAAVTSLLDDKASCYYAWDIPAVCPQAPQLLAGAGILGLVSNLSVGGLPEIFWHQAPDGTRLVHRRKHASSGPRSLDGLREMAVLQRRELAERGLASDILVIASALPPPEPFFLGACSALTRSMPRIVVSGAGGRTFMEDTLSTFRSDLVDVPVTARIMSGWQLGDLVAQPALKGAHGEVENLLLAAETFATFAALLGAEYPDPPLDVAWRQLLYTSTPDRLGFAGRPRVYADTLASLREAADLAGGVLQEAIGYIAGQADTISTAPPGLETGELGALVVFNPCSWTRTDLCRSTLVFPQGVAGLTLFNDVGGTIPFVADQIERSNGRIARATVRFVARDMPALGYRTYYVRPQGALPEPSKGPGAQIENEYFRVLVDPLTGEIARLTAKDTDTELARGPLNAVVGFEEDGTKNAHGRDLWTTGAITRAGPGTAELVQIKTDWMQQLTVTVPFAEGRVVRQLTLYEGVPRVDCEVRFEGVRTADRLLALTFALDGEARAPVFGERYGAVVGRKGRRVLDFRTAGDNNASGTGARPALRWGALSPNDHVDTGGDGVVPLGPCAVVHGEDSQLVRAAREIQTALAMRGIPAATWPDVTRALNPIWTDSTEYPNFDDDLDHGTAMRIVLGSQEQNVFARHLCLRLPEDAVARFNGHLSEGTTLFFMDDNVPDGYPPVPTLLLAGYTGGISASMAHAFAEAVAANGVFSVSSLNVVGDLGAPAASTGLALLYPGAALQSVERDGTMVLLLAHGSAWEQPEGDCEVPALPDPLSYRYALYPFSGTWREAGVVQAAHGYGKPLAGTLSTVHLGAQSGRQSFLAPEHLGFVVTSVRPAAPGLASMSGKTPHPRDGIIVRGYESLGRAWQADTACFTTVREASSTNLLGKRIDALTVDSNRVAHSIGACAIESILLVPSGRIPQGPPTGLGPAADPFGPVFTRYWRQNRGAAPMGFQPLSVVLEGRLAENDASAHVVVSNNMSDQTVSGVVFVSASEGWSIAPTQFDYALDPGSCQRQELVVLRNTGSATTGGVTAWTDYGGQTYRDDLELDPAPLELAAARSGAAIKVTVSNRGTLSAQGYVEIIAPADHWPELRGDGALWVLPRRAEVAVAPLKQQNVVFLLSDAGIAAPFVAKLAANGHVVYAMVR